jgi:GH15 family glucan-1,4-alpha-glucosidase
LSDKSDPNFAVIGNCQIAALIDSGGSIVWACLPRLDRDPVFSALLLFRYRHADDFGVPTTTFTVCAFWYVNALAAIGRKDEARELFGKLLARRNAPGLLAEDIDPVSGERWGNYPQTYSMVGIIISALRLSRLWEQVV